ncbi:hypothetical protein CDIK_0318 [Cucumispora dikerogammari]|nr:hypothetical protein CDIK_0318 [Cucumispora dikerogammari]
MFEAEKHKQIINASDKSNSRKQNAFKTRSNKQTNVDLSILLKQDYINIDQLILHKITINGNHLIIKTNDQIHAICFTRQTPTHETKGYVEKLGIESEIYKLDKTKPHLIFNIKGLNIYGIYFNEQNNCLYGFYNRDFIKLQNNISKDENNISKDENNISKDENNISKDENNIIPKFEIIKVFKNETTLFNYNNNKLYFISQINDSNLNPIIQEKAGGIKLELTLKRTKGLYDSAALFSLDLNSNIEIEELRNLKYFIEEIKCFDFCPKNKLLVLGLKSNVVVYHIITSNINSNSSTFTHSPLLPSLSTNVNKAHSLDELSIPDEPNTVFSSSLPNHSSSLLSPASAANNKRDSVALSLSAVADKEFSPNNITNNNNIITETKTFHFHSSKIQLIKIDNKSIISLSNKLYIQTGETKLSAELVPNNYNIQKHKLENCVINPQNIIIYTNKKTFIYMKSTGKLINLN